MRRSISIILAINISLSVAFGQNDTISLIKCLVSAREHAALKPQMDILNNISELKISNATSTNLPSLGAYGKAWYQSDAIAVPPQSPNSPGLEIDKFQYNFGVEADQKIFDGSMASRTKELERASTIADKSKVETDLYQLNNEVIRYFFFYKLYKENRKVLELKNEVLIKRIKELESGVQNGMVKRNDLDKMNAELLLTRQQLLEVESKCSQMLNGLGMLTGMEMNENPELVVPDSLKNIVQGVRPELNYFDAEQKRLETAIRLKSGQNLPKFYAFGQLGYSYPGLNFFENQPAYYYMLGARLSWTIYDWKEVKRDKMVLKKQEEIIDTRKNDFELNMGIQIENEKLEQEKLISIIELDEDIIKQRSSITTGSAVAMSNGFITSSIYIDDLNAEIKARIDLETHKIQYLNSIVKLYLLMGINVENL